jgi:hypothetical protein
MNLIKKSIRTGTLLLFCIKINAQDNDTIYIRRNEAGCSFKIKVACKD